MEACNVACVCISWPHTTVAGHQTISRDPLCQDGMERRLSQKMNELEVNCNANLGEGVAAGIEEVRASITEAGKAVFPAESCAQR